MKVQKKTSVAGEWAKKGEDIKDGDSVVVNNSGEIVTGDYGDRHVFRVKTRSGEKLLAFNQKSLNNLIDAFGDDTDNWVGKSVKVFIVRAMVAGKLQNIVYLAAEGWDMLDDGSFVGPRSNMGDNQTPTPSVQSDDIPTINLDESPF